MSGQHVGVIGDGRLASAVEAAGGTPIEDRASFGSTRFVLASGETAVVDLARASVDVPVLAVGTGDGIRSVPTGRVEAAVGRVFDGDPPTVAHPVVEAAGPFAPVRAIFDIALMAAEPARISEFAVHTGDDTVSRFRADGVVAATPAGSAGYNRNAGGPIVAPETGVASVVPVAPFATGGGRWILPVDSIRLSIERDETPVELLADGRSETTVEAGGTVALSRVDTIETYVLPESSDPF